MSEEKNGELCRSCNDFPCVCYGADYDEEDGEFTSCCYECGGRGYRVTCIDDLCHGQDECIHGDPPTPCRNCNPRGDKEDLFC